MMSEHSKNEQVLKKITIEDLQTNSTARHYWLNLGNLKPPLILTQRDFREFLFSPENNDLSHFDLSGSDFSGIDLTNANFTNATLTGAKFEGTILTGAKFALADLTRADFSNGTLTNAEFCRFNLSHPDKLGEGAILVETKFLNATMHGADLRETLTAGMQLGGADVTNAKLPEEIKSFEGLKTVEEASKITKRLFTMLLTALGFSALTIFSTKDYLLLTNSTTSPLPMIQTPMPLASFYNIAPFLLSVFFIYFLLNLLHLYKLISRLPAVFPDGTPLDEKMFPWLLNTLVQEYFPVLAKKKIPFFWARKILIGFLAWCSTPIVLFCFWLRYLPRHNFTWSCSHVAWVALATFFAIVAYNKTIQTLKNNPNYKWPSKNLYQLLGMVFCFVLPIYLTGSTRFDDSKKHYRWLYQDALMDSLGYWVNADFKEQEVSHKPDNWREKKPTEGVKGAKLEGAHLDYVDGYYAFLVKANLSNASLKHANLFGANLTEAVIVNSDLTRAKLLHADLSGASLADANLDGVRFDGANIHTTYLVRVRNLTPDQIKKAKHWQLALFDRDFKENKLRLTDEETEIATRAYLKWKNPDVSESELEKLFELEMKRRHAFYNSEFSN